MCYQAKIFAFKSRPPRKQGWALATPLKVTGNCVLQLIRGCPCQTEESSRDPWTPTHPRTPSTQLTPSTKLELEAVQQKWAKHCSFANETQLIDLTKCHWDKPGLLWDHQLKLCHCVCPVPFCHTGRLGLFQGFHYLGLFCLHRPALAVWKHFDIWGLSWDWIRVHFDS